VRVNTVLAGVAAAVAVTGVVVVVAPGGGAARPAYADTPIETVRGVTVDGAGTVQGVPDTLVLQMAVNVGRADVSDALHAADTEVASVVKALEANGVVAKDVQTSQLSVQPDFGDHGRVTGYHVRHAVTASLRELDQAGKAIGAAIGAAGNDAQVDGLTPDLQSNGTLLAQARDRAFADARAKAEQYARLAGRPLGTVQSVQETVQTSQPTPFAGASSAASPAAVDSVPVSLGQSPVSVHVTVVWSLR
jgi:uncharacterized protein YggE